MHQTTRKSKFLIILLTSIFILSSFTVNVPQVSAYEEVITAGYAFQNCITQEILYETHPSTDTSDSAWMYSFTASEGGILSKISVRLATNSSDEAPKLNAAVEIRLYSTDGDLNSYPVDLLATSQKLWLANDMTVTTLPFSFEDEPYTLVEGTTYIFAVVVTDATTIDYTTNRVMLWAYGISSNAEGYSAVYRNSSWTALSTYSEIGFYAYVLTGSYVPTTGPNPTQQPDEDSVTFYTNLLMPIMIPLLIILVCACLGAYFMGKWGFFLGLNVGVIITYVALPYWMPLWGVVLIGVADVLVLLMTRGN